MSVYDKIIKWVISLSIFLTPLFFLPFSLEAFEFNKQYLIFFLTTLGLLAWLAKMVFVDKEIKIKKSPLAIPIFGVLLVAILSTIFSADASSSLLGSYGRFSDGLILLLTAAGFYFLAVNNPIKLSELIKLFSLSGAIAVLFGWFSALGVWQKFAFLPPVMRQGSFNGVSGFMEGFAIFLAVLVVLLAGILLAGNFGSKKKIVFYSLVLVFALGLLIVLDFSSAWIVMLVSFLVLVIFSLVTRMFRENVNKLLLPILLFIVAATFLFVNLPKNHFFSIPGEIILSQGQSWDISLRSATGSPKNIFLGSGPGTFSFDFSKFKSVDFNKTDLWQYRFNRAGSNFAETLGTKGFLGLLADLALIGLFFAISWLFFKNKGQNPEVKTQLPLLAVFTALVVGQFVYYQNTVLLFLFWLILAQSMVNMQKNSGEFRYSFKEFPEIGLFFSVAASVFAVGFLFLYFFGARFYLADVAYLKALVLTEETIRIKNLERAAELNPNQIQYKIILSRVYLGQVLAETAKPADQRNQQKIEEKIMKSIDLARVATEISPKSVAAWENRGLLYREINNLVSGANEWGIKSFETAISLEPASPVYYTELGKLLLATKPEEAKANFNKAIELKSDYSDAVLQQVFLLEKDNKTDEAIKKLEEQVVKNPYDTDALFQLGRFYYNNKRVDEAGGVFSQIIYLSPDNSNALYALGVIYAERGEKDSALAAFKKVLELNPGNQDVIDKIKSLE